MAVFDCHLCGSKKVGFAEHFSFKHNNRFFESEDGKTSYTYKHGIIECLECHQIFYKRQKIICFLNGNPIDPFFQKEDGDVVFPVIGKAALATTLPSSVKKPYLEGSQALQYGLKDSAATMFRKAVYMLCKDQDIPDAMNADEKIKTLNVPQQIKDVLLNIKGIGDWGGHEEYTYSSETLKKAQGAIELVFKYLYEFPEMMKMFLDDTAHEKGKIKKSASKEVLRPQGSKI